MKRILTVSLSLVIASAASVAQISIGQNEMPHAGDDLYRTQAVTNPFVNYAATGPAHTWDFSNLAANGPDTAAYRTVASTNFVYAITFFDLPFNPNRANLAKDGADIAFNQLLPVQNPHTFFYRSASTYKMVGYGVELNGLPVPITFNEQDVIYDLPLNYGDAGSSFSSWNLDVPTLAYYGYQQTRENVVDGWGGITTPGGTFDVLRVMTTITGQDTLNLSAQGIGFTINRPVIHEYKWIAQGLRVPVLQINTTEIFGLEVVNAIYYYDVPRAITVLAPLAATICPGATVDVNYEAEGAFNAGGFFVPANVFTAQLSDASGSFANPVNIGSVTATGSGTIAATIPANTPPGTGYRIRVVSNSPAFVGDDNGFDIVIGGATVASVTASGSTLICAGGSVDLIAVGGPSYQWQVDGTDIPGATDATYGAADAGTYTVLVDNACGSATSNGITVAVNDPPTHMLDPLSYSTCEGSPVVITAQDISGQSPLTYQWYLNNTPIAGETNIVIDATLAGAYALEVTNAATGCTFTTPLATLDVETVATPVVTPTDLTTFCEGGSVILNADALAGVTYQWYVDDVAIIGAADPSLVVDTTGNYTVLATSTSGCVSDTSAVTNVAVFPFPEVPTIIATEPTTFCEGHAVSLIATPIFNVTYQWTLDGVDIPGDTLSQIMTSTAGSYNVVITGAGGCTSTAASAMDVVVNPLPPQPVITPNGGQLEASGTGSFQWYLNGEAIAGATGSIYVPLVAGDYTVTVTDPNGCSSTSDVYTDISTGISSLSALDPRIYPNPSNGSFTLTLPSAMGGATYEIIAVSGKCVARGSLRGSTTSLDLRGAGAGVYVLRLVMNGNVTMGRVVIE